MINQEIYQRNPTALKIVNEGVANVNDDKTKQSMAVLRYELETFVCDGQYEKGLEHILQTYLQNINQAHQPGVWISGFYGSGKSHLVKMLRALWLDTEFEDGATAREIATLPQNIQDHLKELTTQAKRHGGIHAASGTLGAAARGSVRLALLKILFKSLDLPQQYHIARFVLWLKNEGIYEKIRQTIENKQLDWEEELANFYVAEGLHEALVEIKPNLFSSTNVCVETLNNLYPNVQDISNDELVTTIRQILTKEGKFPLTLIALDEVQQFIGEDSKRAGEVQELVETCCKNFGGKLLFIGTGQTAITGTANLGKLQGRFTVRVELSDADVDTVIRKVILAKKPQAIQPIEQVMQTNLGEISRQLAGTSLSHREEDLNYFTQDYPLLPVRRRFWESTLKVLDQTGTESQLRNQLNMVHKAIQTNLDKPLGNVIPADYLYFDSAEKLLQARILPRIIYEETHRWINGTEEEKLTARACGLIFLINKLAGNNNDIGIKATVETVSDLLIEDLHGGSSSLREKLPKLLDSCKILMKVGDEYRIQTKESVAWNDEYYSQYRMLSEETHSIEAERDERIKKEFNAIIRNISTLHGKSKVKRDLVAVYNTSLPSDYNKKLHVWVRDGWSTDGASVHVDALQARSESPTIFVFIPRHKGDDLRRSTIEYLASSKTLEKRGQQTNPESLEAQAAMETIKKSANKQIEDLITEALNEAHVYQGGGNEIPGNTLKEKLDEAKNNSLQRLYTEFSIGDDPGWEKVYDQAKKGSPDALKAVSFDGEPIKNPVCKAILGYIAGGKKGSDIRLYFEDPSHGWPRDTVDGGLQVLLNTGQLLAFDERGKTISPLGLERKAIGKATFKVESTTITTNQRIQVRALFSKAGIQAKDDEINKAQHFLQKMLELADAAGGSPPKPEKPDTKYIKEIQLLTGNDQLLAIFNTQEKITKDYDNWTNRSTLIDKKMPAWTRIQLLLQHSRDLKEALEVKQQVKAIENQRLLLIEPDPIIPILKTFENTLRTHITTLYEQYQAEYENQMHILSNDASWSQIMEDVRKNIQNKCEITPQSKPILSTSQDLLNELIKRPINEWSNRTDALAPRFSRARELAVKTLEPETQTIDIPRRTLKTSEDIEQWLKEVKEKLETLLSKGPIVLR